MWAKERARNGSQPIKEKMLLKATRKYKVFVEGANLLMDIQGRRRFGYFATRYVEGDDVESAAACALELIKMELNSNGALLNDIDDPPHARISGVEKMGFFKRFDDSGKGFTFFPEDE
jgi:hypothetical protein